MNRVKTFEATGIDPNGKLYAGDLNAIQDAAAGLVDLTQNVSVGSLIVGESGLALSRFGAAEAQISGSLRVTKLLRGLEGIIAGAFTTAERDSIASGKAPYGIVILNITTNRYEWNKGTDSVRNWQPVGVEIGTGAGQAAAGTHASQHHPETGVDKITMSLAGVAANRPAANSVAPGTYYFATDTKNLSRSDGAAWTTINFGTLPGIGLSGSQSIPQGAWTTLSYGTLLWEDAGDFWTSGSGITIPAGLAGLYQCHLHGDVPGPNANVTMGYRLLVDGVIRGGSAVESGSSIRDASFVEKLDDGDVVTAQAFHGQAGSQGMAYRLKLVRLH